MSESYFAHYVSPNIIIVPTVSFSPPHTENNTEFISSRHLNTSRVISETTRSDYIKNVKEIRNRNLIIVDSTGTSEHFNTLPIITQDTVPNEDLVTNMSHGVKEPKSKYQSRNNLVDLTGFNILKKDNMSSVTRPEDSKQKAEAKIDPNGDTNKKDNKPIKQTKISSKGSIEKRDTRWEIKTTKEPTQHPTDMEDKMKKYFRHLWRHNIEKISDKSTKEMAQNDSKSNRTRENVKNSKLESCRHKSQLKRDSIIKINSKESSKEYRDFKRSFIAEYSSRSKSETRSCKAEAAAREKYLSSIAVKRYKDFQDFIQHKNNYGTEAKTEKQNKSESFSKNKLLESKECNMKNSEVKKNVTGWRRSTKSELRTKANTNLDNMEKVKQMKSVVLMTNKHANINSQSKYKNECQDLRSRLSRKRSRSECFTRSKQRSELERENLVITLKQNLNTDPKKKAKSVTSTKKYKKIKLVINIECANTDDSDPNQTDNESGTSPTDLSFLDDFNVDEIVDSLNVCHTPIENDRISTLEHSHLSKETIEKHANVFPTTESKPKDKPIDDSNRNTKKNKEDSRKNNWEEEVVIDSDSEYLDLKTGSIAKAKLNQNEEKINTNSENAKSMKQSHKNNKLIENPNTNTAPIDINKQEKLDLCDEKDSKQGIIGITREMELNKTPIVSLSTEDAIVCESNDVLVKLKRFDDSVNERKLGSSINISRKRVDKVKRINILKDKEPNTISNENAQNRSVKKSGDGPLKKSEPKNIVKKIMFTRCEERLPLSNKKEVEINLQKSKDPIEVSLQSMFNNSLNGSDKDIKEEENSSSLQKSSDAVEASLETMFNNIKQEPCINMDIASSNISSNHVTEVAALLEEPRGSLVMPNNNTELSNGANKKSKTETYLQNSEDVAKISLKTTQSNVQDKNYIKLEIEPSNVCDINLKEKAEKCSLKPANPPKKLLNALKYSTEQKGCIQMDIKPASRFDARVKGKAEHLKNSENTIKNSDRFHKSYRGKPEKYVETPKTPKNMEEKDIKGNIENVSQNSEKFIKRIKNNTELKTDIRKNIKEKSEDLQKSKETIKTSLGTPTNKIAEKANIIIDIIPSQTSDINIEEKPSEDTTDKPLKTVKNIISPKLENTNKKSLKNVKHNTELKTDVQGDNIPLSKSDNNVKEKLEDRQESKNSINTSLETPTNKIAQEVGINMHLKPSKTSDLKIKEKSEIATEKSTKSLKIMIAQQLCIQLGIKPMNRTVENVKENTTHLRKSKFITEKSQESVNNNIQLNNAKITKNVQTSTCANETTKKLPPNVSTTTESAEINYTAKMETKSNAEVKPVISQETVTNDIQKPGSGDAESSKTEDSNTNSSTKKENEIKKCDVITMETKSNTNIKQNQVDKNNENVSNDTENTNLEIQKEEIKAKKVEVKASLHWNPFVEILEQRMWNYLDEKYTVTSLIHKGHFSVIYKCKNKKGDNYAIKVSNFQQKNKAMHIEGMLLQLQKYISKASSSLLYIKNSFGVNGQWCFMTEFYPRNLKQALEENNQGFHIDLVQILSRQLVAAVNMLTDNNIIHSDIKPTHILLNGANDRLKLTGFDRSNYSSDMKILPCTGTASYRAPEVILGFLADCKIDIWSTALVMFEMATSTKLFPGIYNNDILYKHICSLGGFDMEMINKSKYAKSYYFGSSYILKTGPNGKNCVMVHAFQRNQKLRNQIFMSYKYHWEPHRTSWQVTQDLDKLETFHSLLVRMLALDPRFRLPIQFVSASEFIHEMFS